MVTPVQQGAVDYIKGKLDDSGWFNTVTHDEMNDVKAKLQSLSATDADAVIDELGRQGQLDKLADQAVDGSWFGNGGYSADERRDLFNDLAGKLDGQSLAAVSNAFAKTDDGADGFHRVTELADAVATHASNYQKMQYVEAMKSQVAEGKNWTESHVLSTSSHESDPEAVAVGKVLSSLKGSAYAADAFKALNPEQLRAVMKSSIDETMTGGIGAPSVEWHPEGFGKLMDAAASIPDADLKARIFDAGADTLRDVRNTSGFAGRPVIVGKDDTIKAMADGLTKIIDSDTTGVMRELTYNEETADGSDMATYSRALMEGKQEKKLGEIMTKLQFGNGLNENPAARLDQVTQVPVAAGSSQERRENAGALGYFVGAAYAGAQSWSTDVKKQQEMMTSVLDSALTLVDKAKVGGPAANAVGTTASVAKEWTHYAVRWAVEDKGLAPAQRLERAALPINPQTRELGVGDNIMDAFNTALTRVQRNAQP
ncbi:hypothetical protein LZK98_06145 [Sphingomonas cannabina]|uniref:hypothetical protein n=1 Tax=Sphingomonas cannabina TaxID=2899123 RepID=UPI001F1D74F7|nr:hypothetical protein [Sphingomonas cannabina]UIJ46528.1 hypothetical protein LZK98_06145 [Sphingomonas cannabina]